MRKSAVIIRNVSGIIPEEFAALIKMADLSKDLSVDANKSAPVQELQQAIINNSSIKRELFNDPSVRDYLHDSIKEKTGNHVILHLNHDAGEDAGSYIANKLANLPEKNQVQLFYLGGGHGGGHGPRVDDETSGLKKDTVNALAKLLSDKKMSTATAIMGSCYSGAFIDTFRPFLISQGVMLSDSVECSDSGFMQAMRWLSEEKNAAFFSEENLAESTKKVSDMRTSFQEFMGDNSELSNKLKLSAYVSYTKSNIETVNKTEMETAFTKAPKLQYEVSEHLTDLIDTEIAGYSSDLTKANNATDIMNALKSYPLLQDCIAYTLSKTVFLDQLPDFIDKVQKALEEFTENANSDHNDDISDGFNEYLACKMTSVEEQNFLKLFKFTSFANCPETKEEFEDFINNDFMNCVNKNYDPNVRNGPMIKTMASSDLFYTKIASIFNSDVLTSKIISTPSESQLLKLTAYTGKPAHSCEDAYERLAKVINLLKSNDRVNVITHQDVHLFNQKTVMTNFNAKFNTAVAASNTNAMVMEDNSIEETPIVDPKMQLADLKKVKKDNDTSPIEAEDPKEQSSAGM